MTVIFDANASTFGVSDNDFFPPTLTLGTVQSSSSTSFTVLDSDGLLEVYTGTGFGNFNAQGVPTSGSISGYTLQTAGGSVLITASNLVVNPGVLTDGDGAVFDNQDLLVGATITGSAFNDTLVAGSNTNISAGAGDDTIIIQAGETGGSTLDAGSGNDTFLIQTGGVSNDVLNGNTGFDTLVLATPANANNGTIYSTSLQGATLLSIEQVQFTDHHDGKESMAFFDLSAFGGAGLASNLNVIGTSGEDVIAFSGSTAGTYDFSQMTFSNWTTPRFVNDPAGDFVQIQATGAGPFHIIGPLQSAAVIVGGSGNDVIVGGNRGDLITGGPGNDTIDGGGGENIAGYGDIASTAATITHNANGTWTVSSAADGTDTLTNIQLVSFSDVTISLVADWTKRDNFLGGAQGDFLIENTSGAVFTGAVQGGGAAFTGLTGLGAEWRFVGDGDFYGDGTSDFMIENTSGAVFTGELIGGSLSFHQVTGLGTEWTFEGTGPFLGRNVADFLIENTAGALVVGEISTAGQATFLQIATLGATQTIVDTGDFVGNGEQSFLIENADGTIDLGAVNKNGQAPLTQIAALGHEWSFHGAGDILGDGKSDFLMENTAGVVAVGELGANNAVTFTALTSLGPEWHFVGTGDYLGEGHDQFLIENTAGAVVVGDWTGGQEHFTQVTGLGPEWTFH